MHGHVELAVGVAAEDAVRGRNVGVVAADGGADVPVVGDQVVGGVEAHPAQMRQQHIDPGVGGIRRRAVVVLAAAIEIAGNVAGGNAHMAQQGNHGVGKILADTFAADDGFINGRVDARGAGHVFEVIEEPLVQFLHQHQRIVAAGYAHLLGQQDQRRSFHGKGRGQQHLPVIAGLDQLIESAPGIGSEKAGNVGHCLLLHDRLGDDDQLIVLAGNIEMLHVVAQMIAIAERRGIAG